MNDPFQLVTNCNFKGKDYLVQMCVINSKKLELTITDKIMAEDWQCEYDASYIEALTHKTGNFKQFNVFVMMLKSGLLKTSDCISLDLLTLEDLEQLRCKRILNSQQSSSRNLPTLHLNRRYLILTYSVEFDRIHYPLPLDYCGPPNPIVLQNNIRKLESEIERLKQKNSTQIKCDVDVKKFKEKIHYLVEENKYLENEIRRLNKIISKRIKPMKDSQVLNSLKHLEEQVLYEKTHNRQTILKLKTENQQLKQEVEELRKRKPLSSTKQRDASRYSRSKISKQLSRNSITPDNSMERKKNSEGNRLDTQFSCRPLPSWNNSNNELKSIKKISNRFLSSSSSESEEKTLHIPRSREKKSPARQQISKTGRKSSKENSRHSSADSKKNPPSQKSIVSAVSQEGRPGSSIFRQSAKSRSRETSLSSRASSKRSRTSKLSNRGSGDCGGIKKPSLNPLLTDREDIKFTMSDLEARIHSLQRLLSEGLHF